MCFFCRNASGTNSGARYDRSSEENSCKKALVPRWAGGRIPLSSQLAAFIRERLDEAIDHSAKEPEMKKLEPLMSLQQERSAIPNHNELLIEECQTTEGFHLFFFPFVRPVGPRGNGLAYCLSYWSDKANYLFDGYERLWF